MNVRLSREIYGNTPWAVEATTFSGLMSYLKDLRGGLQVTNEIKNNHIEFFDLKASTQIVVDNWDLKNADQDSELVYVVQLNGVITKAGGMSSYGMDYLSAQIKRFDADARVKGGIIVIDSGGGSTLGMELMQYTLSQLKKPTVSLIERAGMACSAAYGIAAYTKYIFSESETNVVGSIGTMVEMYGHAHNSVDGDNGKTIRLYATESFNKNKIFEDALNKNDYTLLVNDWLNPVNTRFTTGVKTQRPQVLDSQLHGDIYDANKVVGTLIDAIGSFDDAVNKVLELSGTPKTKLNSNSNKKAMTAQELKSQHPETYKEIYGAGVKSGITAEKDRVGSWMAHAETDLASVKKGISEGGALSATAREEFFVKASNKGKIEELKSDSASDIVVDEAKGGDKSESQTEADAFYANLLND